MTALYLEWVEKAEGDFHTALREYRARKHPNYDAACFHAQQCIEKYLKACLQKRKVHFPKTHDLNLLLDLMLPHQAFWEVFRDELKMIRPMRLKFAIPVNQPQKRMPGKWFAFYEGSAKSFETC